MKSSTLACTSADDGRGRVARPPASRLCRHERGAPAAVLVQRAERREWTLDLKRNARASEAGPPALPSAFYPDIRYDRTVLRPQVGDLVLPRLYTDGVSGSDKETRRGEELSGPRGADEYRAGVRRRSGRGFRESAHRAHCAASAEAPSATDDETIIVLERVREASHRRRL